MTFMTGHILDMSEYMLLEEMLSLGLFCIYFCVNYCTDYWLSN